VKYYKYGTTCSLFVFFVGCKWNYECRRNRSAGTFDGAAFTWKPNTNTWRLYRQLKTSPVYKFKVWFIADCRAHIIFRL